MRTVVLAHGLEGRPDGTKATALRAAGLPLVAPDFRGEVLAQRVARLIPAVEANPGCVLVGSSYGGLASLAALPRVAEHVASIALLAPALHWSEPPVDDPTTLMVPPTIPGVVIHGTRDDVVPFGVSQALVDRCPHLRLIPRDDDHLLRDSFDVIVAEVASLAGGHPHG
jgi:pimeloyl-ACP methyl ester carboxylesterase